MGFIGVQPASVPLTASDITNDIINADKIADNSISEEHLDPTVITGLSALGAEPADTDELLISDAGTLKRMDYSYIKGGGTFEKLLSGSASSAVNHDFLTFMNSSKYHTYFVQFSKVIGLQGNTMDFQFADTGGPFDGSHYWDAAHGFRSNASDRFTQGGEGSAQGRLGSGFAASSGNACNYWFYIYNNPNGQGFGNNVNGHSWGYRADYGDYIHADFTIGYNANDSVTGFRVHAAGNDATTFDYAIYGILK